MIFFAFLQSDVSSPVAIMEIYHLKLTRERLGE